ncbi:MAG: hypothetical protein KGO96_07260 [Elusimicrobia bacterium]|nr:hypothetical protein [Elusimicrobiota bacterium]
MDDDINIFEFSSFVESDKVKGIGFVNPIPLKNPENELLGCLNIYIDEAPFSKAEIFIKSDSPERLDLELNKKMFVNIDTDRFNVIKEAVLTDIDYASALTIKFGE